MGRPGHRGHTLAELLIVVAIVGITAAAVIPTLVPARQQRLEVAVRELAMALRFARDEARRSAGHFGLRVEPAGDRFRVFRLDTSGASPVEVYDVRHPLDKRLYELRLDASTPAGSAVIVPNLRYGAGPAEFAVAFNPRGEPVRPSDLVDLTNGVISLGADGQSRSVKVELLTGRVVVMD